MGPEEIIERCVTELGMSASDAQWVVDNLDNYAAPDFSEWDWAQIDECFTDVLWFKGKSDAEVERLLA